MATKQSPINILLDARKLGDGGIGVYIENLVNGLLGLEAKLREKFNLKLLVPTRKSGKKHEQWIEHLKSISAFWEDQGAELVSERSDKYSLEEYLLLASRQRGHLSQANVFHSPHYTLPFFLNVPSVVTIHDIIHVTHPDTHLHRIVGKQLIASALSRASQVITVSKASKSAIETNFGHIRVPVAVIPNALRAGIDTAQPRDVKKYCKDNYISRPYFVFVGSDRPHKGFLELCRAWLLLKQYHAGGPTDLPVLVAVGTRYSSQTKADIFSAGLGNCVRFVGDISIEDLSSLYSGAEAAIIPSKEEGFGLAALEAMACSTRVVATPLPSVNEICGRLGYYAVNYSAEAIYVSICNALKDSAKEKKIAAGRERAAKYSLESTAKKTLKVNTDVVKRASGLNVQKLILKAEDEESAVVPQKSLKSENKISVQ